MAFNSVTELIGNTPLLLLEKFCKKHGLNAKIFAKLELLNPSGSVKDRTALAMIEAAERSGKLKKSAPVIEATSGNTGIAIAAAAAAKDYRAVIVMPENMSEERRKLINAYGAEIVLTPATEGMAGAVKAALNISKERGGVVLNQFENFANPAAHLATGREIWENCKADILVAGVGTGGTLSGAGRYLKSVNPDIRIIAVEPAASPVLSNGEAGAHGIQGIGAGFVPTVLERGLIDEVIAVTDGQAFGFAAEIARTEGVLAGISSGAALYAATQIARQPENAEKNIAVIFPDSGDRYLSLLTNAVK